MITAAILLTLTTGIVVAVRATVLHDGYGSRPAPRSHPDYFSATSY